MKMPSIFSCCKLDHNEGQTSLKIRSSCFDKPIVINIGSNIDANELIIDFIKKLSAKPKTEPQTEELTPELTPSLNEV
jgi:hypothetical protein